MARHWLPVQGFDEDLADRVFGVSFGRVEARSNAEEDEADPTDPTDPPSGPNKTTNTPQKRRAAAQKPSPRKKNPVAANAVTSGGKPVMAKDKEVEKPTIKPGPSVTTTAPQQGQAPATPESGMTRKEETTPTRMIKPDPEQSATTPPTTTPKNKKQKKANPKASVATEEILTPPPKNSKARTGVVPMPSSWAEAGVADRMLVTMRDNGDDWAKIRKQWTEMTGFVTAASTLPTRYSRLKASMTVLEDGDAARLIQAKDQVEVRLQTEKYAMIADTLEQLGGKRYSNAFIRKEVKKLEKPGVAAAVAAGMKGDKSDEDL